jgi:hypothetical protein
MVAAHAVWFRVQFIQNPHSKAQFMEHLSIGTSSTKFWSDVLGVSAGQTECITLHLLLIDVIAYGGLPMGGALSLDCPLCMVINL